VDTGQGGRKVRKYGQETGREEGGRQLGMGGQKERLRVEKEGGEERNGEKGGGQNPNNKDKVARNGEFASGTGRKAIRNGEEGGWPRILTTKKE
jgi:hypothetical protein